MQLKDSSTKEKTSRDPWHFDELEQGRRACRTRSGFRGLVPRLSHIGDIAAVLYGEKTPYILRKKTSLEEYILIGEVQPHPRNRRSCLGGQLCLHDGPSRGSYGRLEGSLLIINLIVIHLYPGTLFVLYLLFVRPKVCLEDRALGEVQVRKI
ncbi:hypothetical protein F4782DRAFT_310872 [Xylaria castorea]|nr:hypothetical protein F4782DRAFT_310872 [Xylaria castorea]